MKKILLTVCMTGALFCTSIAHAQMYGQQASSSPLQNQQGEDRFMRCANDANCSTRERLQIIRDMHDEMGENFKKISENCARDNYVNCIDPQRQEMLRWHEAGNHMQQMMQALETEALSQKAPAAGGETKSQALPELRPERWWNKLWPKRSDK